jgi:hypothetical protein
VGGVVFPGGLGYIGIVEQWCSREQAMSKHWIVLNDIRVNAAAQTDGDWLEVCRALDNLYNVPSIVDLCDCEEWGCSECGCLWPSRNYGD